MEKEGFTIVEPNVYKALHPNNDLIVRCLEYIRINIKDILKDEDTLAYLISGHNFLEQNYPMIGLKSELDFFVIDDLVDKWLKDIGGVDELLKKSAEIESITWEELKKYKVYPKKEFLPIYNQAKEVLKIIRSIIITSKKNLVHNS